MVASAVRMKHGENDRGRGGWAGERRRGGSRPEETERRRSRNRPVGGNS